MENQPINQPLQGSLTHRPYKALYVRIRTAQAAGRECYIHCRDCDSVRASVNITPQDDPHHRIREALLVVKDNYSLLTFSYQDLRGPGVLVLRNNVVDDNIDDALVADNANAKRGVGDVLERKTGRLFQDHPPETIRDATELEMLVKEYCGQKSWMAYVTYLERLPLATRTSNVLSFRDASLINRVIPFLEMGELYHVPAAAKKYLHRAGLNETEIEKLYRKSELERRKAWGDFTFASGKEPLSPEIRTLEDLDRIIAYVKHGPRWRIYCEYLTSLPTGTPCEVIENIVLPLAKREELWVQKEAQRTLTRLGLGTTMHLV